MIDGAEVAKHNSKRSCWIVIDSQVYDVTAFLSQHPGGAAILLRQAGSDATTEFFKYHSLDVLGDLPSGSHIGIINPDTLSNLKSSKSQEKKSFLSENALSKIPHLSTCVQVIDFENIAKPILPHKSWIYASSSANTGLSLKGNIEDWSRISFRPRIMRDVGGQVNTRRRILGHVAQFPFYISPMGTLGTIHPNAEFEMIKGAVRRGVHTVVSTASTKTTEGIGEGFSNVQREVGDKSPSRIFFQFYIPTDRGKAVELLRKAKNSGYLGIWITVDTPILGKRTADRRLQAEEALAVGLEEEAEGAPVQVNSGNDAGSENTFAPAFGGRVVPGQLSPHTTWNDLKWIRENWDGPIVLKGVQCAEDAKLAFEHGIDGILLSNHGGRQLHSAPSALMTLLEIRIYAPEILGKVEIFLDGGLRDGADVLKALALGATAVGVGRPYLYALAAYGTKGVIRCTDILAEELETAMKLLGVTSLDQLRPDMVNASRLLNDLYRPDFFPVKSRM